MSKAGADDPGRPIGDALVEHHRFLRALARKLIGDPHAADDLVQETARRALQSPPGHAGNLRAWLATVTRRLAFRGGEREATRQERESRARAPRPLPSPDILAAQLETQRRLAAAVGRLAEPYRSTIMLRFFEGLDPPEIAARGGVPLKTVHTRLRRGLDRLRGILDAQHRGGRAEWSLALLPLAFGQDAARAARVALSAGSGSAGAGWANAIAAGVVMGAASFGVGWVTAPPATPSARPAPSEPRAPAPARRAGSRSARTETSVVEPATGSPSHLERIERAATWKDAREIGREIAGLPPDEGRATMHRSFLRVSRWRYRKHLLDAFTWWGVHPYALEILALGSKDRHFRVRQRARWLAGEYLAFRDFTADPEAFAEWYASVEGLALPQVVERGTLLRVDRLRELQGADLESELEAFAGGNLLVSSLWSGTGVDLGAIVESTGLESLLRGWVADDGQRTGVRALALGLLARIDRDRDLLGAICFPILERPAAHDPRLVSAALRALRDPDSRWTLERLRAIYPRLVDDPTRASWAWTLAIAGGAPALRDLLALRVLQGADSPVRFALYELAGVVYDEPPSTGWWKEWWENRPHAARSAELPLDRYAAAERRPR